METALRVIKSLVRTGALAAGEGVGRVAGRVSLENIRRIPEYFADDFLSVLSQVELCRWGSRGN
jgi:hypothetical protein